MNRRMMQEFCIGLSELLSDSARLAEQRCENERLRDIGRRAIGAFEALGKTSEAAGLLAARARCESVMLELQHVLDTPK